MDNYEHEIECPQNKAILRYLWYDYFHDSTIEQIDFDHKKKNLTLALRCSRDIDKKWKKLKGDDGERRLYINEHLDQFTYILQFAGVRYFHAERLIMRNDYINGRFKDTALLRKLKAEANQSLYHFRIQTDDGYLDVVFSGFQIRKKAGRVKYSAVEIADRAEAASFSNFEGGDFERFLAMQKLYKANDISLLEIARKNMQLVDENEDTCLYCASLLGKCGQVSDVPNLLDLYSKIEDYMGDRSYCRYSTLLPKRNILDAIELIQFRNK